VVERLKPGIFDSNASIAYNAIMATLTIRNLPDELRDRLRVRAAERGQSMEAEARTILANALAVSSADAPDLQRIVAELYSGAPPRHAVDDFIREKRREVINEVLAEGLDPQVYFGDEFRRICQEAGMTPDEIKRAKRRAG
jgi:plasmid stability protein